MEDVRDAKANSNIFAEVAAAVVNHALAALTVLDLLDEDRAKLGINLNVHTDAAEHLNDALLGRLLFFLLGWHKFFERRS